MYSWFDALADYPFEVCLVEQLQFKYIKKNITPDEFWCRLCSIIEKALPEHRSALADALSPESLYEHILTA